jgi:hypothetical protein
LTRLDNGGVNLCDELLLTSEISLLRRDAFIIVKKSCRSEGLDRSRKLFICVSRVYNLISSGFGGSRGRPVGTFSAHGSANSSDGSTDHRTPWSCYGTCRRTLRRTG